MKSMSRLGAQGLKDFTWILFHLGLPAKADPAGLGLLQGHVLSLMRPSATSLPSRSLRETYQVLSSQVWALEMTTALRKTA